MAVIDDHGVAGEIKLLLGQRHDAADRRVDRRAFGRGDVDAVMRLARLTVQDALAAVDAGDRTFGRPVEFFGEPILVGIGARASPTACASRAMRSSTSFGGVTYFSGRPLMRWMRKLRFFGDDQARLFAAVFG